MSTEIITLLMLGTILLGVLTGYPIAMVVSALAVIFGYTVWGNSIGEVLYSRIVSLLLNYVMLAVPLFVFMGLVLERSGITEKLYDALYLWLGGLRGGLALATVVVGTVVAATVGVIAASVTMLTVVALPSMIKRGYDKGFACGITCASGTLGILIPPSVMLVIYGPMAVISVGKLFMGAIVPGLLLALLYGGYVAIRSLLEPQIAPSASAGGRSISFIKKTSMLAVALLPTTFLILAVLGSIFMGIAPPTEAAGIGALASVLLAIAYRQFSWRMLNEAALQTFRIVGLMMFIGTTSFAFTGVFIGAGSGDVVKALILSTPGGSWGAFAVIMFIIFVLGFFIDWLGIVFIMVPIITPVGAALKFDALWFAIMVCVNLQMAFMTPPFAFAAFVVKGAAPKELGVTIGAVYRGVIPFVVLIMVGLALCIAFPELILWLPEQMIK